MLLLTLVHERRAGKGVEEVQESSAAGDERIPVAFSEALLEKGLHSDYHHYVFGDVARSIKELEDVSREVLDSVAVEFSWSAVARAVILKAFRSSEGKLYDCAFVAFMKPVVARLIVDAETAFLF